MILSCTNELDFTQLNPQSGQQLPAYEIMIYGLQMVNKILRERAWFSLQRLKTAQTTFSEIITEDFSY